MGYTHYFIQKRNFTDEEWAKICDTTQKIIEFSNVNIQFESDNSNPPQIDSDVIRFNGVDSDGHETFLITREMPLSLPLIGTFRFCKTALKPYDEIVCMILIAVYLNAPDVFEISSDGEWDGEWSFAREKYFKLFSHAKGEITCPWN